MDPHFSAQAQRIIKFTRRKFLILQETKIPEKNFFNFSQKIAVLTFQEMETSELATTKV